MPKFSVTYERWEEENYEAGDTDDKGFVVEDASLYEAFKAVGKAADQPNVWPLGDCATVRWFTNTTFNKETHEWFTEGVDEQRSLHIPDGVTAASRRRIARLLGFKVNRP